MEFLNVYREIARFLDEKEQPHAMVGGLALVLYGLARTTLDLDLAVDGSAQDDLVAFLEERSYQTLHRSKGYSNHLHHEERLGRVDVVYVRGDTSRELFRSTRRMPGPEGLEIPVPRPEHLVAMKVLAMKNDAQRALQDLADIRHLLLLPGVDREEVRGYFERHGLLERFNEIEDVD